MFKGEERGDKFAASFGPAQVGEMGSNEFAYDARAPMMYYSMPQRWYSPMNGPANAYPPMPQPRPAPLSYSHKMPDIVTRVIDNDSNRREAEHARVFGATSASEPPESIVTAMEELFESGTEIFVFTVEEQPRAYNTVHATNQLSFCVWKIDAQTKQITGICGIPKSGAHRAEAYGMYHQNQTPAGGVDQVSRVLTLLFRCNSAQVQVYQQENAMQAINAMKYMRDSFVERQPRLYIYINCLPSVIEVLLDTTAAFLNGAALSLYQASLSWCKLAL